MTEFFNTLEFSAMPLAMVLVFSIVAPPFGATLSLRNEILLGIALPPVGSAIIAGAVFAGVPSDSSLLLYAITAAALFAIMVLLPLSSGSRRLSMRRRELVLAGLFCAGNTLTMLFMALSPQAEAHFKFLLQGELLAVNRLDVAIAALVAILLFASGTMLRGRLYAYSLDEEGLYIRDRRFHAVSIAYRAAATLIITGGIVLIGPLLTTSLIVVPAFICEGRSRGLDRYMVTVIMVGMVGGLAGFLAAIALDLAPAPVIIGVSAILGAGTAFFLGRAG